MFADWFFDVETQKQLANTLRAFVYVNAEIPMYVYVCVYIYIYIYVYAYIYIYIYIYICAGYSGGLRQT